jgi:hypothetical protein
MEVLMVPFNHGGRNRAAARLPTAALLVGVLLAACGGLENPDLSEGAVTGRIAPFRPGGRVYLFGRPDVGTPLAADGTFYLVVPAGPAVLVALDGAGGAALLGVMVAGAEVTRLGSPPDAGPVVPGSLDTPVALPPAGFLRLTARSTVGTALGEARFTLSGTDQRDVAPAASGEALLGPLPAGTFELVVRAPGVAEARAEVEVVAGQVLSREVTLSLRGG